MGGGGPPGSESNPDVDVLRRSEIEMLLGFRVKSRYRSDHEASVTMSFSLSEPKADSVWRGCVHYDVFLAGIVLKTPGVLGANGERGVVVIGRGGDRGRSLRPLEQGRRKESEAGGAPDPPSAPSNLSLSPMGL